MRRAQRLSAQFGQEVIAESGDAIIVPAYAVLQLRNHCPHSPAKLTAVDD